MQMLEFYAMFRRAFNAPFQNTNALMGLTQELEEFKKVHFGAGVDDYNTALSDTAIRVATFCRTGQQVTLYMAK